MTVKELINILKDYNPDNKIRIEYYCNDDYYDLDEEFDPHIVQDKDEVVFTIDHT